MKIKNFAEYSFANQRSHSKFFGFKMNFLVTELFVLFRDEIYQMTTTDLMRSDDHPCLRPADFLISQSFPPQQLASSGHLYHSMHN